MIKSTEKRVATSHPIFSSLSHHSGIHKYVTKIGEKLENCHIRYFTFHPGAGKTEIILVQVRLRQKYYAPKVRPNPGFELMTFRS